MGNEDWSLERPNLPQMDLVSHSLQSLKHYPIRAFEKHKPNHSKGKSVLAVSQ